jgi:AIPR protein
LDDIHAFAASAITEGGNDKKIDIFYLDLNENRAIIAQNYFSTTWGKPSAPDNKASDLLTAMGWLLSSSENRMPNEFRPMALDLRRALEDGEISKIDILFIHNCHEGANVENELNTVANATRDLVRTITGTLDNPVVISSQELGLWKIDELFKGRQNEILIESWLDIPASQYLEVESEGWKAILTTVPGKWVQKLFREHENRLFSANYRDYLGSMRRKGNINQQITRTASSDPRNFWVYNNGITALTFELQLQPTVRARGISIINGAQTTGALSEALVDSNDDVKVSLRIVECSEKDIVHNIIQYNNTQNEIRPADRRSNDYIQNRLRIDFEKFGITYVHRRSNIRNPRNSIAATAIAPALCAFHGDPQTAYRNAPDIFLNDNTYNKYFPNSISVEHIFLVRSLSIALDKLRTELKDKVSNESATTQEQRQYDALKYTASKHFIFYITGELSEEIMGQRVSDRFGWKCKDGMLTPDNHSMSDAWIDALRALLPSIARFVGQESPDPFYEVPRSAEKSKQVADHVKTFIASLGSTLENQFYEIRRKTIL